MAPALVLVPIRRSRRHRFDLADPPEQGQRVGAHVLGLGHPSLVPGGGQRVGGGGELVEGLV